MADTGWIFAGTGTSVAYTGSDVAWLNPGRITANDNSFATADVWAGTPESEYLRASNFGFAIPTGATIDGIEARASRKEVSAAADVSDYRVRVVRADGTVGSTDKAAAGEWPTTEAYATYGGPTDLWGETPGESDIEDVDWGWVLAVQASGSEFDAAMVDSMEMRIYYTEAGGVSAAIMRRRREESY